MQKTEYFKSLDGIRALAIGLILAYHYFPAGGGFLHGGFIGVDIFFVVSGFIITWLLLKEWENHQKIRIWVFWSRRIRRLLPALVSLVAVLIITAALVPQLTAVDQEKFKYLPDFTNELSVIRSQLLPALTYFTNWYFIFQGKSYFDLTDRPSLFEHLWSLAIENQFYLFWPLVLVGILVLSRGRRRWLIIATSAFALVSAAAMLIRGEALPNDARAYFGTDTRFYALMLGATLALIFRKADNWSKMNRCHQWILETLGLIGLGTIILLSVTLVGGTLPVFQGGLLAASLAACLLIIPAIGGQSGPVKRFFESKFLGLIGRRSYSLYLWHWPIFILTEPGYNYPLEGLELLCLRIVLLGGFTEVSYQLIEKTFRNGAVMMQFKKWKTNYNLTPFKTITQVGLIAILTLFLCVSCSVLVWQAKSQGVPGLVETTVENLEPAIIGEMQEVKMAEEPDFAKLTTEKTTEIVVSFIELDDRLSSVSLTTALPKRESFSRKIERVIAIGDSVMLGAKTSLEKLVGNITVNAMVSRQFTEVYRIVQQLKQSGQLPPSVIIHTGTNGTIDEKTFANMMEILSGCQKVIIFNLRVPRIWQESNNRILAKVVPQYKNAVLVDWQKRSSAQREVFYRDGIHLKMPQGTFFYAQLAKDALDNQKSGNI